MVSALYGSGGEACPAAPPWRSVPTKGTCRLFSTPDPQPAMAIKLIANYSKRLGLPGYSSHQFSIEIETELVTTDDVPEEAARIYSLLQANVDEQIQATG